MPFEGEFASYKPLSRIINNPKVKSVIARCKKRNPGSTDESVEKLKRSPLAPSGFLPNLVLAVDGSYHQVPIDNGYPSSELACLTTAAVLIDLRKQRELDKLRPVNPKDFRETQGTTSLDCVLPGCNVVVDEPTPKGSFRREFYETTGTASIFEGGETLVQTYEALLKFKPTNKAPECPYGKGCGNCDSLGDPACLQPGPGISKCPCSNAAPIFSTDALRIHEGLNANGPSGAMFAEAMQVWERLWVVNFLRGLENQGLLTSHYPLAIILDGPLAVFGHPAWLSQAIYRELSRLNTIARSGGHDLLIIGVEKTGAFPDHFEMIDRPKKRGHASPILPQTALLISEKYIREHIVISEGKDYGKDTYFGRKLFYKTKSSARIVATLPFLNEQCRDLSLVTENQFPRLADAMSLLDAVFCVRYPNSIGPLVSAHSEAAIPLNIGRRAFEQITQHLTSK